MAKREPSIHITESKLAKILFDLMDVEGSPVNWNYKKLAEDIVKRSQKFSLNSRSLSVSNDKLDKKVKQLVKASESDAMMLSNLIYHIRRSKTKLYTKTKVEPDSKEYGALKELTAICIEFCNTFELEKKEGFIKYLNIAIPKISSSLNFTGKLVNLAEKVYSIMEAEKLILEDEDSSETKEIYNIYSKLIAEQNGLIINYDKDPTIYKHFIEVRRLTDEIDIPSDIYIKAQFHGLMWTDSYPEPQHLVGDKAMARLSKYMYENKIKASTHKSNTESFADKLKKLKDGNSGN